MNRKVFVFTMAMRIDLFHFNVFYSVKWTQFLLTVHFQIYVYNKRMFDWSYMYWNILLADSHSFTQTGKILFRTTSWRFQWLWRWCLCGKLYEFSRFHQDMYNRMWWHVVVSAACWHCRCSCCKGSYVCQQAWWK